MNLLQLLSPKSDVTYIEDKMCIPTAMETLRISGYTAVPVVGENGLYKGVVSEGDFLWALVDGRDKDKQGKALKIATLAKKDKYPPIRIDADENEVFKMAMEENFVPVIDDRGMFIGIITRRNLINYLLKNK